MTARTLAVDDFTRAADRRLSIAVAISVVVHALALASLRGPPAGVTAYAIGGAGSLPSLQAVLAGPVIEAVPVEAPPPPEAALNPNLVVPPKATPVETLFGRTSSATAPLSGGGPVEPGSGPEVGVAVGTIADPAKLGGDYVAQLAQRFPQPVQQVPLLLGARLSILGKPLLQRIKLVLAGDTEGW